MFRTTIRYAIVLGLLAGLLSSCGLRRKKYDNPISKDTQQPDKVLFDKAIGDIEHSRYEVARLTLQTLINTYDTSEFLAKAKLAIGDSWFREGGSHGLAQAEAEYKDFILFYPTMEESAEAQQKVCDIHYKQMEKADRDPMHALRAEDECRQLIVQFPNSKFAPEAQQKLRNIQEVLADHEYRTGAFYHHKGSFPAAANRLQTVTDQFPLFSQADEALWSLGDSYERMSDRFEPQAAAAYSKIVREYPLSPRADAAKEKLQGMKRPVPEADPVAYARMKYELENREKPSAMTNFWDMFRKNPNTLLAAKSGTPAMSGMRPGIPASVPQSARTEMTADVGASVVGDSSQLDQKPDARSPAAQQAAAGAAGDAGAAKTPGTTPEKTEATPAPPPVNHTGTKPGKMKKAPKKSKLQKAVEAEAKKAKKSGRTPAATAPAATPAAPAAAPAQQPK
jgi:outer membrane protein assembly factor BamD